METWAAALVLAQPMMGDLGIAAGAGVEETLKAEFGALNRPVEGLETVREQLGFIDRLPEADQRVLLEGMLDQSEDMRTAFAAMLAAWARGDDAAIAATFDPLSQSSVAIAAGYTSGGAVTLTDDLEQALAAI
jgi:uncharacterized protein YbaP (TraB family)